MSGAEAKAGERVGETCSESYNIPDCKEFVSYNKLKKKTVVTEQGGKDESGTNPSSSLSLGSLLQ